MIQPVVDRKTLLESVENDAEFLTTVIGIFLTECPEILAQIRSGAAACDPIQIMNASHALRGSVSVFGAKDAVAAARILESMGRHKKLEGVTEAICILEREIALVSSALADIAKEHLDLSPSG
jgi:HPt (histidine-containing phosphotransfer) domain-containing protein